MSVQPVQAAAVVAETQALQLRALMDALGVKTGDTVAAKVTAQVSPTVARLDINGTPLEVRTPQPLPVGATLTFAVERQGQTLKLLLSDLPRAPSPTPAPQAPPAQASPSGAPPVAQAPLAVPRSLALPVAPPPASAPAAAVANPVPQVANPPVQAANPAAGPAPPAATPPPQAANPTPAIAIPQAQAEARAPNASPAPQVPPSPAKPLPVAPPSLQAPPPATTPPPQAIAAALVSLVARGLVTQEAPEASGPVPDEPSAAPPRAEAPKAAEPAAPATRQAPREALAQPLRDAMRQAAGRQESLSGLFADLAALTARTPAATLRALPEPVLRAVATVLGFRLPAEAAATPQGLARAVERSGTFLEARLAALPPGDPPPPDLKAALGQLKAALAQWTETLPPETPEPPASPARLPQEQQAKEQQARAPLPDRPQSERQQADRPPLRGALPQGQPPSAPSLPRDASAHDIARVLTEKTEAALARLTLVQAASLPEARDPPRADAPLQTSVEIPLRLGAETAMLQAQILREPEDEQARARARGMKAGAWAMRFSLEAEPIGPLHAMVRWQAGRVTVRLWAERDATAAALDAARGTLTDALEASAFTVEQLTIAAGRPAEPREAPRREPRLDRLS